MNRADMKNMKKRKKWPWVIAIIGLIIGGFALSVYFDLASTLKGMYKPIDRELSDKRDESIAFDKKDPFSVLVLGVDEREGDKGRSDTMIVMTVNPKLKSTKMVSIPRDTYTEIIGHGTKIS